MTDGAPVEVEIVDPVRAQYEPLLWQRATDISAIREPLTQHQQALYVEIGGMHARRLGISERDLLFKRETEYWRIDKKLQDIEGEEDRLTQALEDLDAGEVGEEALASLVKPPQEETHSLARKKKRIIEEKRRTGIDESEIAYDMYREFGDIPKGKQAISRLSKSAP